AADALADAAVFERRRRLRHLLRLAVDVVDDVVGADEDAGAALAAAAEVDHLVHHLLERRVAEARAVGPRRLGHERGTLPTPLPASQLTHPRLRPFRRRDSGAP